MFSLKTLIRNRNYTALTVMGGVLTLVLAGCTSTQTAQDGTAPLENDSQALSAVDQNLMDMQRCLKDRGWEVEIDLDEDSIGFSGGSADQADAYQSAYEECDALHPLEVIDVADMSDEELRAEYDYEVETYECLIEQGVQPTEPSSFEAFKEGLLADGRAWSAYDGVEVGGSKHRQLIKACPPVK